MRPAAANPSLHPTRYGWLRQPPPAGELQRYGVMHFTNAALLPIL